jgi:SufS family cysteine desulfurase
VQKFIGADSPEEIVFTRGATEAINLVANSYGRKFFAPGDEVIVTVLEHHSNIVPWMMLKESLGIKIKVAPVDDNGDLIFSEYAKLFSPRTRLAAFTHVANSIGTVMPVREMTALAHLNGVKVLIDGAQSIPHFRVNVRSIDADFYIFAGHKVFGPTGIGVLYGKKALLEVMPPWQGGGSMIDQVTFDEVTYNAVPHKFEAGTPSIAEAVGLGAALDYLTQIGFERASAYESSLMGYALRALESLPGIRLIGHPLHRAGSISLVLDGIDTEAVGKFLDKEGIAVRAGHHCAQPSLARFGLQRTVRPSLAIYNTVGEINRLVEALLKAQRELKA